jgi:tetratricopeptide (TPR) repeat protein
MRFFQTILFILSLVAVFTGMSFSESEAAEPCEQWVAKIVSVQGSVQARLKDTTQWQPVQLNNTFCPGDVLRVQEKSRAAVALINKTIIRIDQNTTVNFSGLEKKTTSLIDIITGVVHFISRVPRTLRVNTPFVNGTVEGTEFLAQVFEDHAIFTVFEGEFFASNPAGSITLTSGQSAMAMADKAPVLHVVVRLMDAVQWALYYPPIIYYRTSDFPETGWQSLVRESIGYYWQGDLVRAFSSIKDTPESIGDARFFNYRASLLLSVGRINEAIEDIEQALNLSPGNSDSLALQAIIAVVQNEKEKALGLAQNAGEADPDSATAKIALSYARQTGFDLEGALESLKEAVNINPDNGLAWARLSELQLSFGRLDEAVTSAEKAVALNPDLSRTQTVLGFAYLTRVNIDSSISTFDKAITLDQADPLPRLGMGLAQIRRGELEAGREEIEIAASLDPGNSLIRSYAGKAYYEEKRDELAMSQYEMAKDLDPLDPTPYFYDAIRKQTINRPVEALHDLQKSIELNDNRAVYRSKELLDDDLAARSSSLARIYNDLGFEQLALVEGWNSVNTDPGNYSAHRLLADSYASQPRHEIARVSEVLQSQLLQPLNVTPVQPRLGESGLFILDGAGPSDLSYNEFNPLFNRNRFTLQVSGIAGDNSTYGDEIVISGVHDKVSFSLGQFHYETDGFRKNNDQDIDIYNIFAQASLSHKTSIQTEARFKDIERGDLPLLFNPDSFIPTLREDVEDNTFRFGLRHSIAPHSDVIASVVYSEIDVDFFESSEFNIDIEEDGYMAEVQYLFSSEMLKITGGAGYFSSDVEDVATFTFVIDPFLPPMSETTKTKLDIDHTNLYVYSQVNYPETVTWTIGASADFFEGDVDEDQFNPKAGLTWNPFPDTTVRAAVFRTLKRQLISEQTIEPTQVAGFNQFFDDGSATDAWRYGIGIDQKISDQIFAGGEFSERDLEEPGQFFDPVTFTSFKKDFDIDEQLGRAYVYWTPHNWLALSAEYQYEHFDNPQEFMINGISELDTHRVMFGINFFHPSGFFAKLNPKYISQDGEFEDFDPDAPFGIDPFPTINDEDDFWYVDSSIGYRFPKRYGKISLEAKNLFDENFKFQDTDPSNPTIYPDRLVLVKFTLAF